MGALICKICGYKQYEEDTVAAIQAEHPDVHCHDIPYYCGACQDNMTDEEYWTAWDEMYPNDVHLLRT